MNRESAIQIDRVKLGFQVGLVKQLSDPDSRVEACHIQRLTQGLYFAPLLFDSVTRRKIRLDLFRAAFGYFLFGFLVS
jgi:hypothetical protein